MSSRDLHFREALDRAYAVSCRSLIAERHPDGFWLGELANSALATATAVSALSLVANPEHAESARTAPSGPHEGYIVRGLDWLADHQNTDGGWGDTTLSLSNISTTMLARVAFELAAANQKYESVVARAADYVQRCGGAPAMVARYGADRTFAVPILTNCALGGHAEWRDVLPLPFELSCLPHSWFKFLRLHVVSYALPALIAIGQLIHARRPSRNLVARWIRNAARAPSLRKLEAIQPTSGGFLEAIPLTSFVTMSLAALGLREHPVAIKGVEFLIETNRRDGSWPIDSNLSVWLTTLSINAIAAGCSRDSSGELATDGLPLAELARTRDWLLMQQVKDVHPYTNATPGGWGWSHLSGSVPDADDTAGALIALANLTASTTREIGGRSVGFLVDERGDGRHDNIVAGPISRGLGWLASLQNRDGGWPTFCRGWGHLPFDRSGADLTAHALRGMYAWLRRWGRADLGQSDNAFADRSIPLGLRYLERTQRGDGSWLPLWFGNQHAPDDENPTYGTTRVLAAYRDLGQLDAPAARRATDWLCSIQNADGGWGGSRGIASSVEETALAVEALAAEPADSAAFSRAVRGASWLVDRVESGSWRNPSPIGFYFAKLWYFEKLYPQIFTVAALGRVRSVVAAVRKQGRPALDSSALRCSDGPGVPG